MKMVGENQEETHLQLLYRFIVRILEINRNGKDMLEGIAVMNLIIALAENMMGQIDQEMLSLLQILVNELKFCEENNTKINFTKYKAMVLQAISMCFNYNAPLVFQFFESQGVTLSVF